MAKERCIEVSFGNKGTAIVRGRMQTGCTREQVKKNRQELFRAVENMYSKQYGGNFKAKFKEGAEEVWRNP